MSAIERRYYYALKTIGWKYHSLESLRRCAEREYGLPFEEALEMTYENMREEARGAIGKRRPGAHQVKVIYIAGPFRASNAWDIEKNIRRAEEAALEVWRMGAAVVCPHTNTRFFQGAAPDHVWLSGDIEILKRCDAVLLIDGWERSTGARAEKRAAEVAALPVFQSQLALKVWLVQ